MKRIYIAGPLFTEGERIYLEKIEKICSENGFITHLPHRDVNQKLDCKSVFSNDVKLLNDVDIIVAVLNGPDIDSGTSFEIGYGYAKQKYLIGIRTDYRAMAILNRKNPLEAEINLMVRFSLNDYCKSFEEFDKVIKKISNKEILIRK